SIATNDTWSTWIDGLTASNSKRNSTSWLFTSLTPGPNTSPTEYRVRSNTSTFNERRIIVWARRCIAVIAGAVSAGAVPVKPASPTRRTDDGLDRTHDRSRQPEVDGCPVQHARSRQPAGDRGGSRRQRGGVRRLGRPQLPDHPDAGLNFEHDERHYHFDGRLH